jgi:hypothetical protein
MGIAHPPPLRYHPNHLRALRGRRRAEERCVHAREAIKGGAIVGERTSRERPGGPHGCAYVFFDGVLCL